MAPVGAVGYLLSGSTPTYAASGVTVTLDSALIRTFAPISITPSGPDENASFSANMDAIGDVIPVQNDVASTSSGPGQMLTFGKVGNVTGTFDTEMLALNLSGVTPLGPFMIRESPTRASTGRTTISNIGGGLYQIDSFFDIFTELSLDGGQTWGPDVNGPMRVTLVPEPGAIACTALAGLALLARRRRQ